MVEQRMATVPDEDLQAAAVVLVSVNPLFCGKSYLAWSLQCLLEEAAAGVVSATEFDRRMQQSLDRLLRANQHFFVRG